MQLSMPLTGVPEQDCGACWIVSSPNESASRLAAELNRSAHLFVDADDGSLRILPTDVVLLKDPSSQECDVLAPSPFHYQPPGGEGVAVRPDGGAEPVTGLLALILGSGRPIGRPQRRYDTHLERHLSLLRHEEFGALPWTRFNRAKDAIEHLTSRAHPAVSAILWREKADAARALELTAGKNAVDADEIVAAHREAALRFHLAKMPSAARQTERLLRAWEASEIESFPAFDLAPIAAGDRIDYRFVKVSAVRTTIPAPFRGTGGSHPSAPTRRRKSKAWQPDQDTLRDVVAKSETRKLGSWHSWRRVSDELFVLEIGVDTDFSIQLGLAGKTGLKQNEISATFWGDGCKAEPESAEIRAGASISVQVEVPEGRCGAVDVRFADRSRSVMRFRLEVPSV